ncbi:hypothetical protein BJ508DRAFT_93178 [Ascobolus immersus RN42]|uniref:Uncharacterized protein n=1 Tax=Ascobolus immersus RN42 TaxID=1160509 RepID=A0A3N4I806_ASCIM|nr:hypothetical protein BJ508DRAFT_93178 [Ascobolus immersus RN42]
MSNIYLAAADGDLTSILGYLVADPNLIHAHDPNGYTVLHALASYNHLDILTKLVKEHGGDINIEDDDGDTPLFVVESVNAAKIVLELGGDLYHQNNEGLTAADYIEEDGDHPLVAAYLRSRMEPSTTHAGLRSATSNPIAQPSEDVSISVSAAQDLAEMLPPVDEALKRKIEELAGRQDFDSEDAQNELKNLVREAVQKHVLGEEEDRNVRSRN